MFIVEPPRIRYYLRLRDCEFDDELDLVGQILDCILELRAAAYDPALLPDTELPIDLVKLAHRVCKDGASEFPECLDKFVLHEVCAFMNKKF